MILNATLSKPCNNAAEILGRPYEKIKISAENAGGEISYFVQLFTKTQVFHEHWKENALNDFLNKNAGKTFKNCVKKTENEEITILTNKKGKQTEIRKKIKDAKTDFNLFMPQKKKNYVLQEGKPVPFLTALGIMSGEGKVFKAKYDKFRQINRFLEFLDDAINEVWGRCGGKDGMKFSPPLEGVADKTGANDAAHRAAYRVFEENSRVGEIYNGEDLGAQGETSPSSVLKICDFGCGKSYLTFAIHYFLTEIRHIPCEIEGLDLKADAINYCNELAKKLKLDGLRFKVGNIADYSGQAPDIVVTLHACDTATDFALKYAVAQGAKAILCAPCCQHEVNEQLSRKKRKNKNGDFACAGKKIFENGENSGDANYFDFFSDDDEIFEPLLKWGIIREKFSSLLTDSLRGKWLESCGYKVQMLEFIDESGTPKNILIRAVKKNANGAKIAENFGAKNVTDEKSSEDEKNATGAEKSEIAKKEENAKIEEKSGGKNVTDEKSAKDEKNAAGAEKSEIAKKEKNAKIEEKSGGKNATDEKSAKGAENSGTAEKSDEKIFENKNQPPKIIKTLGIFPKIWE